MTKDLELQPVVSIEALGLWRDIHQMDETDINQKAYDMLLQLLECCTINLVSQLTRVTRTTLYRWLDPDRSLEEMDFKQAAWFIVVCETSPKVQLLLTRGPLSHPRLAKRLLEEEGNDEHTDTRA